MTAPGGPYLVLELTPRCNNDCIYCYNVWKKYSEYDTGEMNTSAWKRVIDKIRRETESTVISFSGGEPMLRSDIIELVRYAHDLGFSVNLITNGTLLTEEKVIELIFAGVTVFEVPLLSGRPEPHNTMAGNNAWQKVIDGIGYIKKHGGYAVGVVVVTKKNLPEMLYTLETAVVLNLDAVMFNRFNPGGTGAEKIDELLPSPAELKEGLAIANQVIIDYGLPITCNIPVQPCLVDMSAYPYIRSGFCACGTSSAYYAIDSGGNMRPCNHSNTILGSFLEQPYEELLNSPLLRDFIDSIPPICEPCPSARVCQGGCKAAAQVCYENLREEEPFLKQYLHTNPMLLEAKRKMEAPLKDC